MTNKPIDQTKCPLCGEDNRCGNLTNSGTLDNSEQSGSKSEQTGLEGKVPGESSSGKTKQCTDCWCLKSEVSFPQALLKQVPQHLRDKSCICKRCALTFAQPAS